VPRPARRSPAELSPDPWPTRPSSDPVAEVARRLAVNVEREIGGRSIRSVAEAAQVDHATLLGLLRGRSWPDLVTIAKLERGLGADVWPGRPAD
jgi:transcriptional regulator with XRE-family HTH domain